MAEVNNTTAQHAWKVQALIAGALALLEKLEGEITDDTEGYLWSARETLELAAEHAGQINARA